MKKLLTILFSCGAAVALLSAQAPPQTQQPSEIELVISEIGRAHV